MRTITFERFQQALAEGIPNEVVKLALDKAGLLVETEAKQKCPVGDTGMLRNSIAYHTDMGKKECVIAANADYAAYVEYGVGVYAGTDETYGKEFGGTGRQTPWVYYDKVNDRFVYVRNDGSAEERLKRGPRPFMEPALVENEQRIDEIMARTIADNWIK